MKFCTNCGAQIQPNSRFCVSCGTPVAQQPQQPRQPAQPQYQQPAQPQYQQPAQPQYQQPAQPQYQQPVQPQYQQPAQPQYQQPAQPQYQQPTQPQYQQPFPQPAVAPAPVFTPPVVSPGMPTLTIEWPGTTGSINVNVWKMNVDVNGVPVIPPNEYSFGDPFTVQVPITSPNMLVEVWLKTPVNKTKPTGGSTFGALFGRSLNNRIELSIDPSQNHTLVLKDPAAIVGNTIIGHQLYDTHGNFIQGAGHLATTADHYISLFVPPYGVYLLASRKGKEDSVLRRILTMEVIMGFIMWITILLAILL